MGKAQEVRRWCKAQGIAVNGSGGIPLLSKADWLYCCDSWAHAYDYLAAARLRHLDEGVAYPWAA